MYPKRSVLMKKTIILLRFLASTYFVEFFTCSIFVKLKFYFSLKDQATIKYQLHELLGSGRTGCVYSLVAAFNNQKECVDLLAKIFKISDNHVLNKKFFKKEQEIMNKIAKRQIKSNGKFYFIYFTNMNSISC